ncbi:MAG: protein kinase [Candidatus Krumholzibacteria bacterium]|nr:protein kinase [Candidatus Krumholzibacteria bacterium]
MSDGKQYQILKLVAKGGTAVLYSAIQTSLDRVVAIKKLHSHLTEDENFTRRFVLEAKAAASLDHENIVKIIDFGTEAGSYHMVMEFIEGESLRGILDKWKQLPVDVALAVVYQVCQGLEHAHAKGIVHRDIKPGNIMLTRTGKVKITDFGLAKLTQNTTQHTAANSILGTPLYMSPEQAFGETVDHRSDLFSLGTTLYETLTGIQPFRDEHYMGVIQKIINRNAPHPSKFSVEIPVSVQSLLGKAMNKSREARFQSAGDFKQTIERYLGLNQLKEASESLKHLLSTDGATVVLPRTAVDRQRKRSLRRGFVVALAITTLLGAAGLAYSLGPQAVLKQVEGLVAWFGKSASFMGQGQMSGFSGAGSDAYLSSTLLDSTASTSSDSAGVATDSIGANYKLNPKQATRADSAKSNTIQPGQKDPPVTAVEHVVEPSTANTDTPKTEKTRTTVKAVRKGWISVDADPWAEVYIDGQYRGDTPPALRVELVHGPHSIECRNPAFTAYHETIHITAGELSTRNIVLTKLTGHIRVSTTAGAEIYVDGVLVGVTPLTKAIELEAGTHQVTVRKVGYHVWDNQIAVDADQTMPLDITLSPLY